MKLSPMQLFCQEKLILASHPWLSFNDAEIEERCTKWCLYSCEWEVLEYLFTKVPNEYECFPVFYNKRKDKTEHWDWDYDYPIIWLPPTLARVLNALGSEFYCRNWIRHAEKISNNYENRTYICQRKLLNEDWTDATLFDQSEETQLAIALLLWWKDAY